MGTRAPEAIVRGGVSREVGLEPSQGGVFGRHLMAGHKHALARSTVCSWPYYALAEAFAALTELTVPSRLLEQSCDQPPPTRSAFPCVMPSTLRSSPKKN